MVNLSAFETFFPEKRPFFLEGSDVFAFGEIRSYNDYGSQEYFYSRRIGRSPQRFPGGSEYADVPAQTTIAAAAKVTGKVGNWTLGLIDGVTPEEKARIVTDGGERSSSAVEPFTNYFAGRARRDFRDGQSVVGGMVTSTIRNVDDDIFRSMLSLMRASVEWTSKSMFKRGVTSGFSA